VTKNEKSARRRRKHCALVVVKGGAKNFAPLQTPFPRGAGRPEFNQQEMITTFTYKPSLVRIDECNFESNHHHQQTNIQLLTGRMRFLSPNQQGKLALAAENIEIDVYTG